MYAESYTPQHKLMLILRDPTSLSDFIFFGTHYHFRYLHALECLFLILPLNCLCICILTVDFLFVSGYPFRRAYMPISYS